MAGRSWRAWVVGGVGALLFGFALCACSNDLDALYRPKTDAGGGAKKPSTTKALPKLPALPDRENVAACEACAKQKCGDARANCLQDDDCIEVLACKGECDNPNCLDECDAQRAAAGRPAFSAWYDDLHACVFFEACSLDCKNGENFACAGNYEWAKADRADFTETFSFVGLGKISAVRSEPVVIGAQARSCAFSPCEASNVIDSQPVNRDNRVELDLNVPLGSQQFIGFLELEDFNNGPYGLRLRIVPDPIAMPRENFIYPIGNAFFVASTDGRVDLEAGAPLAVRVGDCLRSPARNVRIALPDISGVEVVHYGDGLASAVDATNLGLAVVPDVPEDVRAKPVRVQVIQVGTERVVSERDVDVRTGWITVLRLHPLAR